MKLRSIASRIKKQALSQRDRELMALGNYSERWFMPRNLPIDDPISYVPAYRFEDHGLDFDLPNQLARVDRWGVEFQSFFKLLREDPVINKDFPENGYLYNPYYPTPDVDIYTSMMLDVKPTKIIEVGSGYSTLTARRIIAAGGLKTTLTIIDPSPRIDVSEAADHEFKKWVEDVDFSEIAFERNTFLFIDSSHICRGRGDLPFLYCNLIPKLPSGVYVHVHDIFLPYDYPVVFLKRAYTEQYLLYLLLQKPERYKIFLSAHLLSRKYPANMQAAFGPKVGTDYRLFGASFWFLVK